MPEPTATARHVHLYFSAWLHESRAWRAGRATLESGRAARVDYVGYRAAGLADRETRSDAETILRVGAPPPKPGSSRLLRGLSTPWWSVAAVREILRGERVSLIVAHSLASLPAAVLAKLLTHAALLYDAHELETEREGWSAPIRFVSRLVESAFIRFCDHTMVVSPSIEHWYRQKYRGLSISTVRNVPEISGRPGRSNLRSQVGAGDNDLIVIYLGAFARGRGLDAAIAAFQRLGASRRLVLIGDGPLAEEIRRASEGVPNIHVLPPVPPEQVVEYISGADIGLSQLNGTSLSYHFALPNKLFEYAAARLAVIVSRGPEQEAFVRDSGLGWSIEPSAKALADLLLGIERTDVEAKVAGAKSYALPTWATERPRLLEAVDKATGSGIANRA